MKKQIMRASAVEVARMQPTRLEVGKHALKEAAEQLLANGELTRKLDADLRRAACQAEDACQRAAEVAAYAKQAHASVEQFIELRVELRSALVGWERRVRKIEARLDHQQHEIHRILETFR